MMVFSVEYAIKNATKGARGQDNDGTGNKAISSTVKLVLLFLGIGNLSTRSSDIVGTLSTCSGVDVV